MENPLFLLTIVTLYLFLTAYLGYRGFRNTHTITDYLVAGRNQHPVVMTLSYCATLLSTSLFIGFGGVAAMFGMSMLWLTVINISLGILVAFVFFGIRTRSMGRNLGAQTFPELLGKRYDSVFLKVFSAFVILLFMPLYTGVVLMSGAKFIEVRLGMGYETALLGLSVLIAIYVIMGGLKGVMYADAVQGGLMVIGVVLLLFYAYWGLGGMVAAHEKLTALEPEAERLFGTLGHRGWTRMPEFGSRFWWTLVSTIILGTGIGMLSQPQVCVRYMTVKSSRELYRSVLLGGIFFTLLAGGTFIAGALSNVYFFNDPDVGTISLLAANRDVEQIIPEYVKRYLPVWLGDVFFVVLLAAAMSTASSQFHAMGTAAGRDIFETFKRDLAESTSIFVSRMGILLTFLFSVFLAFALPLYFEAGAAIVARGTVIFFGLCSATFLPLYAAGLYSRRVSKSAAIASAIVGFVVSLLWTVFVHRSEAEVLLISDALFGRPHLFGDMRSGFILWSEVNPLVVSLPLSALTIVMVSLVTKPFSEEHLKKCFCA